MGSWQWAWATDHIDGQLATKSQALCRTLLGPASRSRRLGSLIRNLCRNDGGVRGGQRSICSSPKNTTKKYIYRGKTWEQESPCQELRQPHRLRLRLRGLTQSGRDGLSTELSDPPCPIRFLSLPPMQKGILHLFPCLSHQHGFHCHCCQLQAPLV